MILRYLLGPASVVTFFERAVLSFLYDQGINAVNSPTVPAYYPARHRSYQLLRQNYSNQTSTSAGTLTFSTTDGGTTYTSTLAGAIDTVGGITVTPGGAGTSAIGQVTTSLTIE